MLRIFIIIFFLILIFLVVKKFKEDKDLNKEIFIVLIILIGLIFSYQYIQNQVQNKITNLLIAFKEGKELLCNGNIVDKNHFDYESGTMVFISKKIVDIKYPILSCKIKK